METDRPTQAQLGSAFSTGLFVPTSQTAPFWPVAALIFFAKNFRAARTPPLPAPWPIRIQPRQSQIRRRRSFPPVPPHCRSSAPRRLWAGTVARCTRALPQIQGVATRYPSQDEAQNPPVLPGHPPPADWKAHHRSSSHLRTTSQAARTHCVGAGPHRSAGRYRWSNADVDASSLLVWAE